MPPPIPSPTHHRWALLAGALLCLAVALPLLFRPGDTGSYFAFDIRSPLGASFLGGCYVAGFTALAVAWRERAWGGAVVIGPGVFTVSLLTLAVTLTELERFHLAGSGIARLLAWGWLAVAVVSPLGWLYLVFTNDRGWAADPRDRPHLPPALLLLIAIQSLTLLGVGGWLFVAPESAPWPWSLGSPTDRLVGGWLVAFAVTGLAVLVERDEGRSRPANAAGLVFVLFQLLAPLLRGGEVGFSRLAVAYWVFLLTLLLSAVVGLRLGVKDRRPRAAPFVR